ncbi:MAG: outer membrane lipoprotein chaperone LolA [Proteobacteria bacterium]|jgi:outer membrane lipoprotein carrier protein|nr:outer membrane lipoprotein chaperone LolA [Ramlibacter sp.]MCA0212282.1 outer membrane lipoprotein chaperone LolA [Pseudomonadota bacterium]
MKKQWAFALLAAWAAAAGAAGMDSLEAFVKGAKSGKAEFTQVVTSPSRDGQAARTKTSSGTFEFSRPNRFRFHYKKPFEQTIVADGQTLWLHDVDLNQVTARKQAAVLGTTPAALIAAAPDLGALQKDFALQPAADRDGLQWVQATPRTRDGQLQHVRVGFKGADLAALEILDSFGQRSLLTFANLQTNVTLAPDAFQFKPPAGADVIRQ